MLVTNRQDKLYSVLNEELSSHSEVSIATAYVTPGGCELIGLTKKAEAGVVRLAIGRALQDGLSGPAKAYLSRLHEVSKSNGGGVRVDPSGWHSKLYVTPDFACIGSSNLTEHGLSDWTEANVLLKGQSSNELRGEALRLYNGGLDFDSVVDQIPHRESVSKRGKNRDAAVFMSAEPSSSPILGVEISLLSGDDVPGKSGLNWRFASGRPRDLFECCIRFPTSVHREAEFVFGSIARSTKFIALTHDGHTFTMQVEGSSKAGAFVGKQIATSGSKSVLGRWMIEKCLGFADGRLVERSDLIRYGRTSVSFYRIGTTSEGLAVTYLDFLGSK